MIATGPATWRCAAALLTLIVPVSAAHAELPQPVRAMIEAAMETGDAETVRTVIELAHKTNPGDTAQIDAMERNWEMAIAAAQAVEEANEERTIRQAGLFDRWSGRGELGAFNSTGNSSNTGLTAAFAITREGIDWNHELRGRADYQRSGGVTTREQFLAAYEPNLTLSDRLFAYALAQFERDRFQGFSARYSVSGGLGYVLLDREDLSLSIQGGPAYRRTERLDGVSDTSLAALASADFDWDVASNITVTQDASAFIQSDGSTYISDTGIQAGIAEAFKVRLSYTLEHDTDPPFGAEGTDTLSRITIIYDF